MKNFVKIFSASFIMLALAFTVPLTTLNAQSQLKDKKAKKMVVLRQKNQPDRKPDKEEIKDFGVTPKGQKARQVMAFKSGYDLLVKKGVKFNPNILLYSNWRQVLRDTMTTEPEFQSMRREGNKLKGAHLADTLVLPETVELTGDTVIVANRVIFEGKNILIKGNHDIAVFSVEPITQVESSASVNQVRFTPASFGSSSFELKRFLTTSRIVRDGSITVDTSGAGRKEWLEKQRLANIANQPITTQMGMRMVKAGFSFAEKPFTFAADQDTSGAAGADGADGADAFGGMNGQSGSKGANGSCVGDKNGTAGNYGTDGGTGGNGGNGAPAGAGGTAGNINFSISAGATDSFTFKANGGEGGRGGKGGTGGIGGTGGSGGTGGNGADCPCINGGGGSGGRGGEGGNAGSGGKGGNGANGGDGGGAGTIVVTYPSGFDASQKVSTQANPGAGGAAKGQGTGGSYGATGSPGDPGKGAGPFECAGADGTGGNNGRVGEWGDNGDETGSPGAPGAAGSVSVTCSDCGLGGGDGGGGGGGGGGGNVWYYYDYSPGWGGGCTTYYWVQYLSWDGGRTWFLDDSYAPQEAGCW